MTLIPAAAFCEECLETFDPEAQARPVDVGSGVVTAATLVFEDRMGHQFDAPVWVVQVEFPDAVGSVIGRLLGNPEDEVPVGLPVELVATKEVGPEHVAFRAIGVGLAGRGARAEGPSGEGREQRSLGALTPFPGVSASPTMGRGPARSGAAPRPVWCWRRRAPYWGAVERSNA